MIAPTATIPTIPLTRRADRDLLESTSLGTRVGLFGTTRLKLICDSWSLGGTITGTDTGRLAWGTSTFTLTKFKSVSKVLLKSPGRKARAKSCVALRIQQENCPAGRID